MPPVNPPRGIKRSWSPNDSLSKASRKKITQIPQYGVDFITVLVGTGKTQCSFTVHTHLLSKHSEFFRVALEKACKESDRKEVPLPDHDPEQFQMFQHFIYSGQIYSMKDGDVVSSGTNEKSKINEEWSRLARAWIFGDVILSTSFKDALVDSIIRKTLIGQRHSRSMQDLIYPRSTAQASIRILLVDIAVWKWKDSTLESLKILPGMEQFLVDLSLALNKVKIKRRQGNAPWEDKDTCVYHEHGKEGICYKKMF